VNKPDIRPLYGAGFGFNTDRRVKPVHFATGFFVSLLGRQYGQRILNQTVAFSEGKDLEGDYALPNLHKLLLTKNLISSSIGMADLQVLRKHLRCLVNNDGGVYAAYAEKGGFGCDYTTAAADVLTRLKDNDGFSGFFVFSVLNQTSNGKSVLDFAKTWLSQPNSTWRQIIAPLLDNDFSDEDSAVRYENKRLGVLDNKRLRQIAKRMSVQTGALEKLCQNADVLTASESKLRVLVIGLCLWLFRYLINEGVEDPAINGIVLIDMLGDSSSKMRAQSRWSFARLREELIEGFSRFQSKGRFENCEEAWVYVQKQMGGRPKFEEFYRELALRGGWAQPRASRIAAKHFELQPETLRVAVMSVLTAEEGMTPITNLLDRLFANWGFCFGGRPDDGIALAELGYTGLDQDQDLTPNTEALITLLYDLGLAMRFSDGLVMCHVKESFSL
jgi:hypothetical protein